MAKIKASALIELFEKMLSERWAYEWGAAREGCVDCSGAFVFAYRRLGGLTIAHGSNSIFRQSIGKVGKEPKPGYAAFKCKPWTDEDASNSWYGKAPGNISHIALVDASGQYVLNAKGTAYGFCRDKASGYQYFAPLVAVDYSEEVETPMDILYKARCTGDQVRVRDEGGTVVGHINTGDVLPVVDDSNPEWIRVEWRGAVCKVSGKYLTRIGDNVTQTDDVPTKTTIVNDATGFRLTLDGVWHIEND